MEVGVKDDSQGKHLASVLHTWGQNLQHHPHVHCMVRAAASRRTASVGSRHCSDCCRKHEDKMKVRHRQNLGFTRGQPCRGSPRLAFRAVPVAMTVERGGAAYLIAVITRCWARLMWPALAARHASPWRRKISATSRFGLNTHASRHQPNSGRRGHRRRSAPAARAARPAQSDLGAGGSIWLLKHKKENAVWNRRAPRTRVSVTKMVNAIRRCKPVAAKPNPELGHRRHCSA
jgi:hypothetical protein